MQWEWFVLRIRDYVRAQINNCYRSGAVRTSPMIAKMLSTEATTTEEKRRTNELLF